MIIEVDFYVRPDGTEPVREFLDSLTPKIRAKMFREIDLLVQNGQELRMPHSRPIGDGIFEIRARQGSDTSRVLYFFFLEHRAILTNGFVKKTQKTPKREIEIAKKYRQDYLERMSEKGDVEK